MSSIPGKTSAGSATPFPSMGPSMRKFIFGSIFIAVGPISTARADIPFFNAVCPQGIEVHADKGGPIFINGSKGNLTTSNKNYYEAKGHGVTVSLSIGPDGSPLVSYTRTGGGNGICQVKD